MNEKTLWGLAIVSSLMTCGLLIPVWTIFLMIYYIVKAFRMPNTKPVSIPMQRPIPKLVLPTNEFASDWTFVIKERIHVEEES